MKHLLITWVQRSHLVQHQSTSSRSFIGRTLLLLKVTIVSLVFVACQDDSPVRRRPPVSTEVLDTIKTLKGSTPIAPGLFETAFLQSTALAPNKKTISLTGINIGKLKIPGGKIIACDPLHMDEYGLPFTQVFPTGEFPVQLSIAALEGDERIAFGRIVFSDAPVVRWEMALQKDQKPRPVGGEEIEGYAVDAGVVIFLDEETKKSLNKSGIENLNSELFAEMNKHNHNKWKYAMHDFQNQNLAAFTTGLGDGRYATYIGFDITGKPCRLVTDFELFDWKQNKQ